LRVKLTEDDLAAIRTRAAERLDASFVEYLLLRDAVREKLPTVTDAQVSATIAALKDGSLRDDGQASSHAALCCAYYLLAAARCKEAIALLAEQRADGTVIRNLLGCTSVTFEALGGLAVVLNGGVLAQNYIDRLRRPDRALDDMQTAFDALRAETGKAPSQRSVAKKSGYSREAVASRWAQLRNQPK
jgi:hypothetical protein